MGDQVLADLSRQQSEVSDRQDGPSGNSGGRITDDLQYEAVCIE